MLFAMSGWDECRDHYRTAEKTGNWDPVAGNTNAFAVATLLGRIDIENKKAYDVGSGDAAAVARALELLGRGKDSWRYTAIDAYAPILDSLKLPGERLVAELPKGLEGLPPVDLVLCLFVLQDLHREEGERLLNRLRDVVSVGGDLVISATVNRGKDGHMKGSNRVLAEKLTSPSAAPEKHKEDWRLATLKRELYQRDFELRDEVLLHASAERIEAYLLLRRGGQP